MADITMCKRDECKMKSICYRYNAPVNHEWQAYTDGFDYEKDPSCFYDELAMSKQGKKGIYVSGKYRHYKKKEAVYTVKQFAQMQIDDKWIDAVVYRSSVNNEYYVRELDDFIKKFTRVLK